MSATEKNIKKMLINARQSEELRVALVEGNRLIDFDVESAHIQQKKDNIYLASVSRVVPSLNACFVDYGSDKHGFLPLKDISPEYFPERVKSEQRSDIKYLIREGQELLIQVKKEERGSKGAALSTFISLAGCYLVLLPNNNGSGGISRQIEGGDRQQMKEALEQLEIPEGMSVILRTAGLGRDPEELKWDLRTLLTLWDNIRAAIINQKPPTLIYKDSDVILRSIRDYLREDIAEIIVDHEDTYNRVLHHVKRIRQDYVNRLKLYTQERALFSRYQIESQIESAYQHEMTLPSGGSIVIDYTEALTAIDINSAKSTQGSDIEATALATNLEAAEEIARQARIRDFGGLIVIDFIDMLEARNQRTVENHLAACIKRDRARVQLGHISRFGLLEMSRQRIRPSIGEQSNITCPRCEGLGRIRGLQSIAASLVRLIEEEALKNKVVELQVQMPVDLATYVLNEKRGKLRDIENQNDIRVIVIPNPNLETPHYQLTALHRDGEAVETSYEELIKAKETNMSTLFTENRTSTVEEPLVKPVEIETAPLPTEDFSKSVPKKSLLKRLWQDVFGSNDVKILNQGAVEPTTSNPTISTDSRPQQRRGGYSRRGDRPESRSESRDGRSRRGEGRQGQRRFDGRQSEGREDREPDSENRTPRDHASQREGSQVCTEDRRNTRSPDRSSSKEQRGERNTRTPRDDGRNKKGRDQSRREAVRKTDAPSSAHESSRPGKMTLSTMPDSISKRPIVIVKTSDQVQQVLEKNETLRSLAGADHIESKQATRDLPSKIDYNAIIEDTVVNTQFVQEARQKLLKSNDTLVQSNVILSKGSLPVHIDVQEIEI